MTDLYIAIGIMLLLAGILGVGSYFLFGRLRRVWKGIYLGALIAAVAAYFFIWEDTVWLIKVLPFQAVIVYGNLMILFGGMLAGCVWRIVRVPMWRRLIIVGFIGLMAFFTTSRQLTGRVGDFENRWVAGVCLQTRQTSCVAAASATLLKHYGIDTTEEEMANLCLTKPIGTSILGLYRGLRIKTKDTLYKVKAGKTGLEKLQKEIQLPAILIVRLTNGVDKRNPKYASDWGWQVDVSHSIVVFEIQDENTIIVGDPSTGWEVWNMQAVADLWHGDYVTLE